MGFHCFSVGLRDPLCFAILPIDYGRRQSTFVEVSVVDLLSGEPGNRLFTARRFPGATGRGKSSSAAHCVTCVKWGPDDSCRSLA